MQNRILTRSILLFLITTCLALAIHSSSSNIDRRDTTPGNAFVDAAHRPKRAFFQKKQPGFFRTLFQVTVEQWNDTKNTISAVNKQINDNFLPENLPQVETTTSSDPNISTTTMAYKITRTEFNRILQRNLKGIARLINIEMQDALKQSEKNYAEFKRNASKEISKFF